jgi:class 3 adenylate cyclase
LSKAVKEDLRKHSGITGEDDIIVQPRTKPFANVYFKHHTDVTILFADIVNFTPLTTSLEVSELVAMLDDLFGKFDEAAEVRFVLTNLKKLGDLNVYSLGVKIL